jgi:DNA-binding SARP family transcriptional activator
MLTPWRVRLLGDFRAERGRQVVTRFRSKTVTALFAFLCLHPGRRFSREELADRFWPDADVEAGRASLRVALNSLKKVLEPLPDAPNSVIEADRESIRLRPEAVIVDVREFEKALKEGRPDDALSLYGGDFLPSFWDEWILDEQARLQALVPDAPPRFGGASGGLSDIIEALS